MRDLLQEKDRTREAVSQIVSWCLVIALHQTEGIGKKRQDDVAAKALVIQEAAAKRLARQSRGTQIAPPANTSIIIPITISNPFKLP